MDPPVDSLGTDKVALPGEGSPAPLVPVKRPRSQSCFYFTEESLKSSPSRLDGISEETEMLLRYSTAAQIMEIVAICKDLLRPAYSDTPHASSGGSGSGSGSGAGSGAGGGPGAVSEDEVAYRRGVFKQHHSVTAIAVVMFHRFFSRRSFRKHDRLEIAIVCVLTASAITDDAVPLSLYNKKDTKPSRLIQEFLARRGGVSGAPPSHPDQHSHASSSNESAAAAAAGGGGGGGGEGSSSSSSAAAAPGATNPTPISRTQPGVEAKERLVTAQRLLLFTLEYDLTIEPATTHLVDALAKLRLGHEPKSHDVLCTIAKKTLWDALKTTLPIRFHSKHLALGVLKFASDKVEGEAARRALQSGNGTLPTAVYTPPGNMGEVINDTLLPPSVDRDISAAIIALITSTRGYGKAVE